MKPLVWLIAFSVAANVLLAGLWLKGRRGASTTETKTVISEPAADTTPSLTPARRRSASASSPKALPSSAVTSWKDLQTEDLKEFIQRLRAASCPEETIQDIIVPEVNRRYAVRNRELWPERYAVKPFWEVPKNDPYDYKTNRERSLKDRELQKEKSALLVELLGVDPEKERRKTEGLPDYLDYNSRRVSFLPESKREAVTAFLDEFQEKQQEFYTRNRGMHDAQYRAEQKQLEAERERGLAQFLSPDELREFGLRQSQLASQLSHDLRGVTVTREQYEAIYDTRKKYGDSIYNYGDIETKEGRDQVTKNKEALQAELAVALGREKAREFERSQDYYYQQLDRLARRNDLPADTAAKIFDFKETAEASVKQLKADTSLSEEQRQTAYKKIRDEIQQAVKDSLGPSSYTNYLRQGGYWINNLAPAPASRRN